MRIERQRSQRQVHITLRRGNMRNHFFQDVGNTDTAFGRHQQHILGRNPQQFLEFLRIPADEIRKIREYSRKGPSA